jgi:hypothetical protein
MPNGVRRHRPPVADAAAVVRHRRKGIRRGSFDSVKQLVGAIRAFIEGWNELPTVRLDQDRRRDPRQG